MPYKSIVCVKQVPDTANITGEAMKADGTVNRAALPTVFNPDDLHALEAAMRIRDRHGGTVTALTMGPVGASEVLRQCLFRGADRAVIINDRRAAASDTLATSYILSRAIQTIGEFDLVFCGRQAIDGDTAQVGPQLAEKLQLSQITYLDDIIELSDRTMRVKRNVGSGWEIVEARLPLLFTVMDSANEPWPASARRMMRYKRARCTGEVERDVSAAMKDATDEQREKEHGRRVEWLNMHGLFIEQWNLDDIGADLQWCGLSGSPTKVHRVQSIVLSKDGFKEVEATEDGVRSMIHELIVDHTLG